MALALLAVSACAKRDPCAFLGRRYDALPKLKPVPKDGVHELRVVYLEDGRVPGLDAAGRASLYRKTESLAEHWLGYRIRLREVGARDLRAEFSRPDVPFRRPEEAACIAAADFDPSAPQGRKVVEGLVEREYAARGEKLFSRLFPDAAGKPRAEACRLAVERFMDLHRFLSSLPARGGPLLQDVTDRAMYSFLYWASYLRWATEADFYLTNAAMLVPDNDMPIYVLARGGLTTGFVDNAPQLPYGGVGVVTLMPFLGGARLLDPSASPTARAEDIDAAATMVLHELGHFLARYGEKYGEAGCVHVASQDLRYFQWHRAIREADNRCAALPELVSKY